MLVEQVMERKLSETITGMDQYQLSMREWIVSLKEALIITEHQNDSNKRLRDSVETLCSFLAETLETNATAINKVHKAMTQLPCYIDHRAYWTQRYMKAVNDYEFPHGEFDFTTNICGGNAMTDTSTYKQSTDSRIPKIAARLLRVLSRGAKGRHQSRGGRQNGCADES